MTATEGTTEAEGAFGAGSGERAGELWPVRPPAGTASRSDEGERLQPEVQQRDGRAMPSCPPSTASEEGRMETGGASSGGLHARGDDQEQAGLSAGTTRRADEGERLQPEVGGRGGHATPPCPVEAGDASSGGSSAGGGDQGQAGLSAVGAGGVNEQRMSAKVRKGQGGWADDRSGPH